MSRTQGPFSPVMPLPCPGQAYRLNSQPPDAYGSDDQADENMPRNKDHSGAWVETRGDVRISEGATGDYRCEDTATITDSVVPVIAFRSTDRRDYINWH